MKKVLTLILTVAMIMTMVAGCGSTADTSSSSTSTTTDTTTASAPITLITREDGSGTRSAFVEITGIDDGDGDRTTVDAVVMDSTGKVMTAVSTDEYALGYISLGSLNDTVKAVQVDGVTPSLETILDGSYTVARPFNIAVPAGAELSPIAQELIDFIYTAEGQAIVEDNGYIPMEVTTTDFVSTQPSGAITVGGSTSVYPVMEKLVEAYNELNPNATINLEGVGSSAGMTGAVEGTFDIGMASRELKDSEKEVLTYYVIAMDGIAVVVNNANDLDSLSIEEIMNIYIGEITNFNQLG